MQGIHCLSSRRGNVTGSIQGHTPLQWVTRSIFANNRYKPKNLGYWIIYIQLTSRQENEKWTQFCLVTWCCLDQLMLTLLADVASISWCCLYQLMLTLSAGVALISWCCLGQMMLTLSADVASISWCSLDQLMLKLSTNVASISWCCSDQLMLTLSADVDTISWCCFDHLPNHTLQTRERPRDPDFLATSFQPRTPVHNLPVVNFQATTCELRTWDPQSLNQNLATFPIFDALWCSPSWQSRSAHLTQWNVRTSLYVYEREREYRVCTVTHIFIHINTRAFHQRYSTSEKRTSLATKCWEYT